MQTPFTADDAPPRPTPLVGAKVLQLIPASGWRAVYRNEDGKRFSFRLTAWALVERVGEQTTLNTQEGIVADGSLGPSPSFAAASDNFVGYIHEDDIPAADSDFENRWAPGELA